MLVSISKAAEMAGITRATLYRHIEKKGITIQKDDDDNPKIDTAELIRVYGDKIKISHTGNVDVDKQVIQGNTTNQSIKKQGINTEVLEERIRSLEENKTVMEGERVREREMLSEQIDMLRNNLGESEQQQKRLTLLLEDQTGKSDNTSEWQKSLKAMEARISNQEKAEKDRAEREEKILRQNRALKKKLDEEKNKSFWQRLFG